MISTTGISTERQLACTAWRVAGIPVITSTCCSWSAVDSLNAVMAISQLRDLAAGEPGSIQQVIHDRAALLLRAGGPCSRVARGVKKASIGLMAEK